MTDNAIRKRCKIRNIPLPPVGYWAKYNHKHFNECKQIKEKIFENWNGIKPVSEDRYFGKNKNPIGLNDKDL